MTGQWEQYVACAAEVMEGHQLVGASMWDTACQCGGWTDGMHTAHLAEVMLATVAPLIAGDTRTRMVEAAVTIMKREGFDGGRAKIAEEIAQAIEAQAGNGEWAGDYYRKAAQIAREIGAKP